MYQSRSIKRIYKEKKDKNYNGESKNNPICQIAPPPPPEKKKNNNNNKKKTKLDSECYNLPLVLQ